MKEIVLMGLSFIELFDITINGIRKIFYEKECTSIFLLKNKFGYHRNSGSKMKFYAKAITMQTVFSRTKNPIHQGYQD